MTDIRSLAPAKIASVITANSSPQSPELLPTAVEQTKAYNLPLICSRSGLTIGGINIITVAGHMPLIGQWRDSMTLHPLFSLQPTALLHFSKNAWFRYCSFSLDENEDGPLVKKQEQLLQVAALAMLHHMTEVRQDIHWLPDFKDVATNWSSLMALSYWKNYLDSPRFRFPHIHLSRLENELDLRTYLNNCWSVKKQYESAVNEKIEAEKLKAAEIATIALRDMLAGARPTSNRQLWRWFITHMPARYKKDLEGWMAEIFFAKGEEIRKFTIADIDLLEEYFLCECPTGTSVSHAFSEILDSKRKYLQQHFEAFEILVPTSILQAKAAGEIPVAEPLLSQYPNKVAWMIARAKWKLAHTDLQKHMRAAAEKQQTISVTTSTVPPTLSIRGDEEDEQEQEDIEGTGILDAATEDAQDRDTDHSGEYET